MTKQEAKDWIYASIAQFVLHDLVEKDFWAFRAFEPADQKLIFSVMKRIYDRLKTGRPPKRKKRQPPAGG